MNIANEGQIVRGILDHFGEDIQSLFTTTWSSLVSIERTACYLASSWQEF